MTPGKRVPIIYSGFWDRPLGFVARRREQTFYFTRGFSDELDEYESEYAVYLLPPMTDAVVRAGWGRLEGAALARLPDVPVAEVNFDETHRRSIGAGLLDRLAEGL